MFQRIYDMSFCRPHLCGGCVDPLRKFKGHCATDMSETEIKTNLRRVNRVRLEPNGFVCGIKVTKLVSCKWKEV